MSVRADAHLHFFQPGYVDLLPESCRRVQPDEVTLYQAWASQYDVQQALVVGYEGQPWAAGNNDYLAHLAAAHDWVRPLAFVSDVAGLTPTALAERQRQGFVGLSFYLFEAEQTAVLERVPDAVWAWLAEHRWPVSVNARGERWLAWAPVLARHPELRLLVSHLGLPPAVDQAPSQADARRTLQPVLALATYPGVRVKLSGFYALTEPGYAYPHRSAWPYVEVLLAGFGVERLLWGSDFSPSQEWVSFPQTFALFEQMPFLSAADVRAISGGNLLALLDAVK